MIFGIIPVVILFIVSSILAVPITSYLPADAPASPSLPNRRNQHSFPSQILAKRLESPPPDPSITPINKDQSRSKTSQRNAIIAISTIGGTFVLCFLLAIVRCICRYRRPPKRDLMAEAIERQNLQREMEELARNPHALRRPSVREPAPPYVPRPPSYSEPLSENSLRVGAVDTAPNDHPRNDSTPSPMNSPSASGIPITHRQ